MLYLCSTDDSWYTMYDWWPCPWHITSELYLPTIDVGLWTVFDQQCVVIARDSMISCRMTYTVIHQYHSNLDSTNLSFVYTQTARQKPMALSYVVQGFVQILCPRVPHTPSTCHLSIAVVNHTQQRTYFQLQSLSFCATAPVDMNGILFKK